MGEWLKKKLDVFTDFETQFIEQTADDKKKNLPPVIKGRSRKDYPDKKTILIYNHYDVMPVSFFGLDLFVLTFEFSRPAKMINGIL